MGVQVFKAAEDLVADFGEEGLGEDDAVFEEGFKGSHVHVLHTEGDVAAGEVEDAVALDDVGGVCASEDGDLTEDLPADGGIAVSVDDLEGVDR